MSGNINQWNELLERKRIQDLVHSSKESHSTNRSDAKVH